MMVELETTILYREKFSTAPLTSLDYFGVDGDGSELLSSATSYAEYWGPREEYLISAMNEREADSYQVVWSKLLRDCAQAFAGILNSRALQANSAPSQDVVLALDIGHIRGAISGGRGEREASNPMSELPFICVQMSNLYNVDRRAEFNFWTSIAWIDRLPRIQKELDEYGAYATAMEFFVIMAEILEARQFASTENYKDVLGSWIADYFRGEERITCAVSRECVQVLSFLGNVLDDKRFELSSGAKESVVRYLEELVCEGGQ